MTKKVFIGVGHGGSDPGAQTKKYNEADLNLSIAKYLKAALVRCGIKTGISRTVDENDRLVEEIKECNAFGPDLAVEIHNNAGGGDGMEVFYYPGDRQGKKAAKYIIKYCKKIGQNEHGNALKGNRYNLGWLNDTKATAVLCECAFVDSSDVDIIGTVTKRQIFAEAIAKGVCKYLGVAYKRTALKNNCAKKATVKRIYKTSTARTGKKPSIKTGYIVRTVTGVRNSYLIAEDKAGKSVIGWTRKKYIK